mmetsp:Transcript_96559/g.152766  ORF Transcript_96559/g.152766 Transcript_96559/m.152766 type:complete len:84 (-) Transcript_96559:269-520(-)
MSRSCGGCRVTLSTFTLPRGPSMTSPPSRLNPAAVTRVPCAVRNEVRGRKQRGCVILAGAEAHDALFEGNAPEEIMLHAQSSN